VILSKQHISEKLHSLQGNVYHKTIIPNTMRVLSSSLVITHREVNLAPWRKNSTYQENKQQEKKTLRRLWNVLIWRKEKKKNQPLSAHTQKLIITT
jgi:hypothetical protein